MSGTRVGSVTVQFDTRVPAVYVYLRDPKGFRSHQSKQIADGVIVDVDEEGEVMGIELLGPQDLVAVLEKVIPENDAVLKQLESKRKILEEILASASA